MWRGGVAWTNDVRKILNQKGMFVLVGGVGKQTNDCVGGVGMCMGLLFMFE